MPVTTEDLPIRLCANPKCDRLHRRISDYCCGPCAWLGDKKLETHTAQCDAFWNARRGMI